MPEDSATKALLHNHFKHESLTVMRCVNRWPVKERDKSLFTAYLLWLFGGWAALHLIYLRRYKQAFVYWCTIGGYCGVGLLRDLFRMPAYVNDVNEEYNYIKELSLKMQQKDKPPFQFVRYISQVLLANSWCYLIESAVPKEDILGVNLAFLSHLSPFGTALGVWVIGNIGRQQGDFTWAFIGAYAPVPFSYFYPSVSNWSSVISPTVFNYKVKWRRTPYARMSLIKVFVTFGFCWLLFLSLWTSYLYFNAEVTNKHGEKIKLRHAMHNFMKSPMMLEFKKNLWKVYEYAQMHGWRQAGTRFIELLDPFGERHALKVLDLKKGATQEEITSQYRTLSKKWHPDRHKEESKLEAQERFVQIQQAYDKLSDMRTRRNRKNTISP